MWAKSLLCSLFATATLLAAVTGCAVFNDHESSLIQISSSRNPVKARRLTLAGVSALENGKRDYAREKLQAAIEADPDYGPAHNNLGLLQLEEGRLYQSVLSFERAMELLPTDPTDYYTLPRSGEPDREIRHSNCTGKRSKSIRQSHTSSVTWSVCDEDSAKVDQMSLHNYAI